jgi:hypothetical protein
MMCQVRPLVVEYTLNINAEQVGLLVAFQGGLAHVPGLVGCRGTLPLIQSLVNGFIRYIYIPLFHSNLNIAKIIKDIGSLDKKPSEEVTFVVEVRTHRSHDIQVVASKVIRYGRIVE